MSNTITVPFLAVPGPPGPPGPPGASTGPGATLVFQPGGSSGPNVYPNWTDLVTAATSVAGPLTVYFDGSRGTCTIPSGAWVFTNPSVVFDGSPANAAVTTITVSFATGATVSGVATWRNAFFTSASSSAVVTITPSTTVKRLTFQSLARMDATGGAPFLTITGSTTAQVLFQDGAIGASSSGAAVITSAGASSLVLVSLEGVSSAFPGSITGAGAQVFLNSSAAQNLTAIASSYNTLAPSVGYQDTSGNWATSAPTNAGDALKRLAAAVEGILGHSIP